MLETVLLWLTVAFVIVAVLSAAGFFVARRLFIRTAERVSTSLEQRGGGAARQLPMPEDPVQLLALGAFILVLLWAGLKILRG